MLKYFLSLLVLPCLVFASDNRSKLEDMYIWKMSDELKLSTVEDRNFSITVKDINSRRSQLNESLKNHVTKSLEIKKPIEQEKWLKEYKALLGSYNRITIEEVDRIKKILGQEKALKYFALKSEMVERFKNLVTPQTAEKSEGTSTTKPAAPKVIEEK